jgi:hypothetical protein
MIGFWNDPEKVTGEPKRISKQGCFCDFSYYAKGDAEVHNIYVFEHQ